MSGRELDAAGITEPALRASYQVCRKLNARHGRTYFLATRLLPAWKRPYVHALYGFARYADEIVDDLAGTLSDDERAEWLQAWSGQVIDGIAAGRSDEPVVAALVDTLKRWGIGLDLVESFLASMRMDLTVKEYATYDDLLGYVRGSAVAIGLQMLPILEPVVPAEVAGPYAADLATAFQLTNFIRDVGEDLRRGRVYLPREELAAFGVDRELLQGGVVDGRVRRALAFQVARTRETYRSAAQGIRLVHPSSRPCLQTALALYAGILDEVERADYRVLDQRVAVGLPRRAAVALPSLLLAASVRRRPPRRSPHQTHHTSV